MEEITMADMQTSRRKALAIYFIFGKPEAGMTFDVEHRSAGKQEVIAVQEGFYSVYRYKKNINNHTEGYVV